MIDDKYISNSDLIDFIYTSAVENLKEEWLETSSPEWYNHIISLPEKERVVYTISVLDMEVNNGGFNQYFVNGYGQFARETIKSLELISACKTAEILTKALDNVQNGLDDDDFRKELLEGKINDLYDSDKLDDYLMSLDNEYYEYEDDLGKLLGNYLRD